MQPQHAQEVGDGHERNGDYLPQGPSQLREKAMVVRGAL